MDEPVGTCRDGSCGPIDGQVFVRFILLAESLWVPPIGISTIATSSCMCTIKCHIMTHMAALPLPNMNDKRNTFHHSDTSDTPKQYHFSSRDADTLSLLRIIRPSSKIALCASLADIIFCTSVESSSSKPSDGFCKTILVNPLTRWTLNRTGVPQIQKSTNNTSDGTACNTIFVPFIISNSIASLLFMIFGYRHYQLDNTTQSKPSKLRLRLPCEGTGVQTQCS
jgi:hypothetical protein